MYYYYFYFQGCIYVSNSLIKAEDAFSALMNTPVGRLLTIISPDPQPIRALHAPNLAEFFSEIDNNAVYTWFDIDASETITKAITETISVRRHVGYTFAS